MQEHLGTADSVRTRDLWIEDLLGGDRRQPADHRFGHREHTFYAVDLEVSVPDIVRRRRKDRDQPAIGQDPVARRIEDPAGLEVEPGKVTIGLVAVAGKEHTMTLGQRGERFVLRSVGCQRSLRGPLRDGLAPRRTGEDVLRQHDELELGADPAPRALERLTNTHQRRLHPACSRFPIMIGVDPIAIDLQRQRCIAVEPARDDRLGHGAPSASRSSARSLQVSRPAMRPWVT